SGVRSVRWTAATRNRSGGDGGRTRRAPARGRQPPAGSDPREGHRGDGSRRASPESDRPRRDTRGSRRQNAGRAPMGTLMIMAALSFHEHNTRSRVPQLISRLEAGERVAIVTDAGTPGVSDPGLELVQAAIDRKIIVDPIPGASAPLTALIASGFEMVPFTVLG